MQAAQVAVQDSVPTALELEEVRIAFPRAGRAPLVIVDSFDLRLTTGQIHCLVGRSGSGKTSLLRVAVGTLRPNRGHVLWAGTRISELNGHDLAIARRKHMGYVDQGASVLDDLRVIDNVLLPAVPQGIDKAAEERAWSLLELFGLASHGRSSAGTLSGGERQRVAIARAMLLKPTVVCVDEPTASLDRDSGQDVIRALIEVARGGSAVLTASHDRALVDVAHTTTELD